MFQTRVLARLGAAVCAASLMAGCAALPRSGPDDERIRRSAAVHISDIRCTEAEIAAAAARPTEMTRTFCYVGGELQYILVDIEQPILAFVNDPGPGAFRGTFGGGRGGAPELRVGVGDVVQVSIFESAAGGLFVPAEAGSRPGNFIALAPQTVDQTGTISVPYAGQIRAAGRSLPQIQAAIEAALKERAIEPQAIVALTEQRANQVAVVGQVNAPNTFALSPAGNRVLDVVARAGGSQCAGHNTFVTLQRGGRSSTVFFNTLVENARENIFVAPGDTVYVFCEERTFLAFGATGESAVFRFEADRLSLAQGVAKAGGLLDERADPKHVFLYRLEDRDTLARLGIDLSQVAPGLKAIPTIYRADLREPTGFFLAQNFPLTDDDIIYISNADSVELLKLLTVINAVAETVEVVTNRGGSE